MSISPAGPIGTADAALIFAALGDPRRLMLVERLQRSESMSITALCEGMDVTRQAVSKHLKFLGAAQLVSSRKQGRETHYTLERRRLRDATSFLEAVGAKWDDALGRLQAHLAASEETEE